MRSIIALAGALALLAGCSFTTTPAVVAAPSPTFVATIPSVDSDLDGVADAYDRYPLDSRFR